MLNKDETSIYSLPFKDIIVFVLQEQKKKKKKHMSQKE